MASLIKQWGRGADRFLDSPAWVRMRVLAGIIMWLMGMAIVQNPRTGPITTLQDMIPIPAIAYAYAGLLLVLGSALFTYPRADQITWAVLLIGGWVMLETAYLYHAGGGATHHSVINVVADAGGFFALCLGCIRDRSHRHE